MARIPSLTDVSPKIHRTHIGPGAVKVGHPATDFDSVGTNLVSVGLTDGGIEWSPNISTEVVRSDQLYNPYDAVITEWNHQVSFSLDQVDIYNLALGMSHRVSSVIGGGSILSLNGYEPAPYRTIQVITEGHRASLGDAQQTQQLEFFRTLIYASGSIAYSRTAKSTLPITAICLGNNSDVAGRVVNSTDLSSGAPNYE